MTNQTNLKSEESKMITELILKLTFIEYMIMSRLSPCPNPSCGGGQVVAGLNKFQLALQRCKSAIIIT